MRNEMTTWVAPDLLGAHLPTWARTSVQDASGTVFVPAALGGNELAVALSAVHDGETLVRCHGHVYLRADWMRVQFTEEAETIDVVERRVRNAADSAAARGQRRRGYMLHDPA